MGAFRQRILLQILDRLPGDLASVHKESTFCPFKENAIVAFARDNHFDIVRHFDLNFEARGRVILILNQGLPTLIFHWQLEFDRDDFAGARVSGRRVPSRQYQRGARPNQLVFRRSIRASCGRRSGNY